jgi:hypothetical protein
MAQPMTPRTDERIELGTRAWPLYSGSLMIGIIALAAAVAGGFFADASFRRFYFAYLIAFSYFLSIAIGGLFFVLIQHLVKAGWSVTVRRIAETMACAMPLFIPLAAPILVSVAMNNGALYSWAQPLADDGHGGGHGADQTATAGAAHPDVAGEMHGDAGAAIDGAAQARGPAGDSPGAKSADSIAAAETAEMSHGATAREQMLVANRGYHPVEPAGYLVKGKRPWLNIPFFIARILGYVIVLSAMGVWYWRRSVEQDQSGNPELSLTMQRRSAPLVVLFGLVVTFAAFDLLMSLDPTWYSTMFGVYYFTGGVLSSFAAIIVIAALLQRGGFLTASINTEHYHDLGKFLFAFVFFWGYIAFSQYMLLWYANLPDTIGWLVRRGLSTSEGAWNGWSWVAVALLVGKLFLPFAGLLSRHVKRRLGPLVFWAVWLLVFQYIDLWWLIMPQLSGRVLFGPVEIAAFVGVGGLFVATMVRIAARHPLRPVQDPRLGESLAFQNL